MWIFLNDSFLSIVTPPKGETHLLVRARAKGDIERVFPRAKVDVTPVRDYRYRAYIPREVVARAIARRIMDTDYRNFKGSVEEEQRHDAYMSVWCAMHRFQTGLLAPPRPRYDEGLFRKDDPFFYDAEPDGYRRF